MEKDMTMETSEREKYLLDIITAVSCDTSDVYSVNVAEETVTPYRVSGEAVAVAGAISASLPYKKCIETYISNNVIPEDQEVMFRTSELSFVLYELSQRESFHIHYRVLRDGVVHYYIMKCVRVGKGPEIRDIVFIFASMDKSQSRRKMLEDYSIDELTGVMNRQAFLIQARKLLDDHPDTRYDMVVVDVENFKLVNAVYGDAKGDEVLKFLGEFVYERTLETGLCGRIGADRFASITPCVPERNREWLLKNLDEMDNRAPVRVNAKCGVYTNVDHTLPISVLCDRALLAVKSIKRNFSLKYATYDGPVSTKHMRSQMYEAHFDRAILEKEFQVWFQPKFDANTEKVIGAEALVRWKTMDGKFAFPGEFIPTFEEDGLIVRLDEYVFRNVCERIKVWLDKGVKCVPISVNLSRSSLHYEGTVERYQKIIEETGIPMEYVPLEITESATVLDEGIRELMQELRNAGFTLHMDDFGSGLSSLSSINMLPINVVKLDKSLIDFIGDKGGDELLKHTVSLAHFKNLKVIAEGVEVKSQLDFLRTIGVDEIQGYYFAKPMTYEDLIEFFKEEHKKMMYSK